MNEHEIIMKAIELFQNGSIEYEGKKYKFMRAGSMLFPCDMCSRCDCKWDNLCSICAKIDIIEKDQKHYLLGL